MASKGTHPAKMTRRTSMGLSGLSNQVFRKVTKKGFEFTLMVVGGANLGKTTLLNTLFLTEEQAAALNPDADAEPEPTQSITTHSFNITEGALSLRLNIIDTPGFGDHVNTEKCWKPLVDHIDGAFYQYLADESKLNRANIEDHRVHCCLYFISPSQHGLRPLDVITLTQLHNKVNIIPVIAKADTLSKPELKALKEQLLLEFEQHSINVFRPSMDDDDESEYASNLELISCMPFAVVGSTTCLSVGGKIVRGRQYPWGTVEVNNPDHCDFALLRNMIVRSHLQDLKDITAEVLYENYRKEELQRNPALATAPSNMRRTSVDQAEKEQELLDSEAELLRRHEQMKRDLEEQARLLEEKRRAFEEERRRYEEGMQQLKAGGGVPPTDSTV